MKKGFVTLKDVAARAGVSHATVSGVLGGSSANNSRVSAATRERILDAARHLQYRPNETARSLKRRRTNMIGLYEGRKDLLNPLHPVGAAILGGLQRECGTHRLDLILYGALYEETPEKTFHSLADGRVDGLIVWTGQSDPVIRHLEEVGVPMVAIVDAIPGIPSVVVDDAGGARLLAEYLFEQGHRHLGFCPTNRNMDSINRRKRAFQEVAQERQMQWSECAPFVRRTTEGREIERLATPASALDWLGKPREERPTAVAGAFDEVADAFIGEALRLKARIPEDIAVVGFDGINPSRREGFRLTTVRAPWTSVGIAAAHLLNQRLNGETIAGETMLPVEFAPGDTA